MTVAHLIKFLQMFPPRMEVLEQRMSDLGPMKTDDWSLTKAVPQDGEWVMRSHPTMSEENKAKEKNYLVYWGN